MEFRDYLQQELLARFQKNPRYSLRAFARSLELEPSALSKILRGKRAVSLKMEERLKTRLGVHPTFSKQKSALPHSKQFEDLSADLFQVISDWYHYAIIELTQVKNFDPSPRWIARALNISAVEATAAIERLLRLGLLKRVDDGYVRAKGHYTNVDVADRTAAAHKYQKQLLQKALEAIDEIPTARRENSGMTMAIRTSRVAEAEAVIRRFRRNLMNLLEEGEVADEVYQLVVAFYPLSRASDLKQGNKQLLEDSGPGGRG